MESLLWKEDAVWLDQIHQNHGLIYFLDVQNPQNWSFSDSLFACLK